MTTAADSHVVVRKSRSSLPALFSSIRWSEESRQVKGAPVVKIVYLDQNHWIELARGAYGLHSKPEVLEVLAIARHVVASHTACFPLSFTHMMEIYKNRSPDRRARLARFMLELSNDVTTADLPVVVRHEAHSALSQAFPGRIVPPEPLTYLGRGLSHAAGKPFAFSFDWPRATVEVIPDAKLRAFERDVLSLANLYLLSGTLPSTEDTHTIPPTDLGPDRRFKDSLAKWRGAAQRYPPSELKRRIYAITLADMEDILRAILRKYNVPLHDFALLGETGWCQILDSMPSRRVDMHLRFEWAKNPQLTPRDSDLNDWASLGIAVSYCDVVVTEKQTADLLNRGLSTRATVLASLTDLPSLLA